MLPPPHLHRLANLHPRHFIGNDRPGARSPGVANRRRSLVLVGGVEHLPAFIFIGRCADHHVGYAAQEAQIEGAMVGRAVLPHQAGAVDGEGHIQVLQGHVVNELVVAALQEGGVDGDHRLQAVAGHAGRQRDGVLFGDGHVVVAVLEAFGELHHTRALAHGGGNADQPFVLRRHVAQPATEHVLVFQQLRPGRLR